jgi:hypothetical protein
VNGKSYEEILRTGSAYVMFELPITTASTRYELTLRNEPNPGGSVQKTLTYDGTIISDGANTYSANNILPIGVLDIPLVGLGSISGGDEIVYTLDVSGNITGLQDQIPVEPLI